ncbi:MAG: fibro-slime domain-containing protein [Phycisphaerae bacterium]|nr:fibro-slime domain-containing protein [Phycisphaerae bacterium]
MLRTRTLRSSRTALALALAAGAVAFVPRASWAQSTGGDQYSGLPPTIRLTGIVRDFKEKSVTGGHADFERDPTAGFGHYVGQAQDYLDADGKPVFKSTGFLVSKNWTDAQGRNIIQPKSYLSALAGDKAGGASMGEGGSLTTAAAFSRWYRDVAGVNMSQPLSITLARQPNSNTYVFDDKTDALYKTRGGFFPINGELFGNSKNESKNFHFTFELGTEFVYKRNSGQVFTFTGDDDVWVYVDGRLVIDIGGVHAAVSQTINLDRLAWLEDGKQYALKFFFAERHRTQSNFRISTTINLVNAPLPQSTALCD